MKAQVSSDKEKLKEYLTFQIHRKHCKYLQAAACSSPRYCR